LGLKFFTFFIAVRVISFTAFRMREGSRVTACSGVGGCVDVVADGEDDDACCVAGICFLKYAFPIAFDGAYTEVEHSGNFLIGKFTAY
jgi:hypothetical protein